jgi:transglutaminase-like putative cysteine protease
MTKTKRTLAGALAALLMVSLLAACGQSDTQAAIDEKNEAETVAQNYLDTVQIPDADIEEEAVALTVAPALTTGLLPVASGTLVRSSAKAEIDYSNTVDGYVMAKFTASSAKKIKAQVKGPTTTYTYNLTAAAKDWTTFPLSDGNGSYTVTVYENTTGTKYAAVCSVSFNAQMTDAFAPFLRPNQYVDYAKSANTLAKAAVLTKGMTEPLDKVKAVYTFVVNTLTYDRAKASTVKSGYLPVLDTVLAQKKGICFDYAALMTAMLRSQGVPCKLVVGYVGNAYHAWISVWSEKDGWINAAIYFDGSNWQRMDPTFASSGKQSASIMKYIGDGSHYTEKYIY